MRRVRLNYIAFIVHSISPSYRSKKVHAHRTRISTARELHRINDTCRRTTEMQNKIPGNQRRPIPAPHHSVQWTAPLCPWKRRQPDPWGLVCMLPHSVYLSPCEYSRRGSFHLHQNGLSIESFVRQLIDTSQQLCMEYSRRGSFHLHQNGLSIESFVRYFTAIMHGLLTKSFCNKFFLTIILWGPLVIRFWTSDDYCLYSLISSISHAIFCIELDGVNFLPDNRSNSWPHERISITQDFMTIKRKALLLFFKIREHCNQFIAETFNN